MRLFISYSTDDLDTVKELARSLKPHAEVFYWDKSKEPGTSAWDKIFSWIDIADLVVAIITDKTVSRAMAVGQEIGRARAKKKTIVPLVAPGVKDADLGCLDGITYITLTEGSLDDVTGILEKLIYKTKKQKEQANKNLWTVLIVLGLASAIFGGHDDDDYY
jgi:hypothetical protein